MGIEIALSEKGGNIGLRAKKMGPFLFNIERRYTVLIFRGALYAMADFRRIIPGSRVEDKTQRRNFILIRNFTLEITCCL